MLDSDASFFLVPEFQSSRGARRTLGAPLSNLRFDAAPGTDLCMSLAPDPGTFGVTAKTDITITGASAVPTGSDAPDFLELPSASGPEPLVDTPLEDTASSFSFDEDNADIFLVAEAQDDCALSAETPAETSDMRAVTPRRPMRFTFARDTVEHSRLILPIPNLFENTFEDDTLTGPGIDPRLQRSRARARARLAAHEATLPPEARNLWCDEGGDPWLAGSSDDTQAPAAETDAPLSTLTLTETTASDGSDGQAPRRAVRHLTVTRRSPKPRLPEAEIHDPLQSHLHQVRQALYTPDPEEERAQTAAPPQGMAQRLVAALVTVALMLAQIISQLRQSLSDQTRPLRDAMVGNGLRLPSRAIAIIATIFALAQTIPPNLM